MEHIRIALVSEDQAYGKALGMALLHVCRAFLIRIFNRQEIEEYTGEESFDLIVWDGALPEEEPLMQGCAIRLVEKPSMVRKDFSRREFCLYRYSCAQSFVADFFEIYGRMTGRHPVNVARQDIRILAFASWEGGAGCSTIAIAAGRELCRYHQKKVLYLSLEEVESTENFFKSYRGAKSLGRYLYYLFRKQGDPMQKPMLSFLDGYVLRDEFGLEAFAPTRGRNPLRELSPEDLFVFLDSLMGSGRYDTILLDVGAALSPLDTACLELAEKVCLIGAAEGSFFREAQYMQYLICRCGEHLLDKFIKVENRVSESELLQKQTEESADREDPILPVNVFLGKSRYFSDEKKGKRLAEEGAFQSGIAALTEHLLDPLTKS